MKPNRKPATGDGFKKVKIPKHIYKKLLVWYLRYESTSVIESTRDAGVLSYIRNAYKPGLNTTLLDIGQNETLSEELDKVMNQELSQWSGFSDLVHTSTYGIRTYEKGDILQSHTDRPNTHIISAILSIYQEDMEEPWGLQIKDHNGWWHEVFLEPGEMVFYESDILEHGRMYPLQGEKYANLFIHYKPADYDCGCDGRTSKKITQTPQINRDLNFTGFHNASSYNIVGGGLGSSQSNEKEINTIKNVLSKKECKQLIEEYTNFDQARTHAGNVEYDKEYRKAQNAVYKEETELLKKVRNIIAEKTGTHVDQQERPISIVKYEEGGEYKPHHDYYTENHQAQDPSMGNRLKTAILYLNDDYTGGETHFPNWDMEIKGRAGDMLVWNNLNSNGTLNTDTLHAGKPVKKGTKYIIVSWIREKLPQPQYLKI